MTCVQEDITDLQNRVTAVETTLDNLPTGPQGPVGPQGPQGIQGPVGPGGPAGPTDPALVAAGTAIASAIATSVYREPSELAVLRAAARNAETKMLTPSFVSARGIGISGNSYSAGRGSTRLLPAIIADVEPGVSVETRSSMAGSNLATNLADWLTYPSDYYARDVILMDSVFGETATTINLRRNWAKGGAALADYESMRALCSGGADIFLLTTGPGGRNSAEVPFYADYRRFMADAHAKIYGGNIFDFSQYIRDWMSTEGEPDAICIERDLRPIQMASYYAAGTGASVDYEIDGLPIQLSAVAGSVGVVYQDSTNLEIKVSPPTGGTAEYTHPGTRYYERIFRLFSYWRQAKHNAGCFLPAGVRLRTTANVSYYALIGQLPVIGTIKKARIVAGNDKFLWTVTNSGAIYRTDRGIPWRGVHTLLIELTHTNNKVYYEFARVEVESSSGDVRPVRTQITNGGVNIRPEIGLTFPDGKQMSAFFDLEFDSLANTPYVMYGIEYGSGPGTPNFVFNVNPSGGIRITSINSAGQLVINYSSTNGQIVVGTRYRITLQIDLAAGICKVRKNGVDVPTSANALINADMTLSALQWGALSVRGPFFQDAGLQVFQGKIGCGLVWMRSIDWATEESDLVDGSFNYANADNLFTVGGFNVDMVFWAGRKEDMLIGGKATYPNRIRVSQDLSRYVDV